LEQHGACAAHGLSERHRASYPKGVLAGIHIVRRPKHQGDLHVDHRKPGKHPGPEAVAAALVDRRDELARDDAALDGIHELIPRTSWQRLQVDDGMAVLAPPARLLDELALDALDRLANGFTIRHLRPADRDLHTELAPEP